MKLVINPQELTNGSVLATTADNDKRSAIVHTRSATIRQEVTNGAQNEGGTSPMEFLLAGIAVGVLANVTAAAERDGIVTGTIHVAVSQQRRPSAGDHETINIVREVLLSEELTSEHLAIVDRAARLGVLQPQLAGNVVVEVHVVAGAGARHESHS